MEVSIEELKQNYSILSNEELLRMHASGQLTQTAYKVIEEELDGRGIPIPERPEESVLFVRYMTWRELWNGDAPLAGAWTLLAVLSFVANGLSFMIEGLGSSAINMVVGLFLPLFAFSLVSIWRCAWNTNWKGWGYLSRTVVVFVLIVLVYTWISTLS